MKRPREGGRDGEVLKSYFTGIRSCGMACCTLESKQTIGTNYHLRLLSSLQFIWTLSSESLLFMATCYTLHLMTLVGLIVITIIGLLIYSFILNIYSVPSRKPTQRRFQLQCG